MKVEFEVNTSSRLQAIDITNEVNDRLKGIEDGVVLLYVKHTTCGLIVNEAEEGLMSDYVKWLGRVFPINGDYLHNRIDNNGHAHLSSAIVGNSRLLPVSNGKLDLGTWQRVILLEFDGPRRRVIGLKTAMK
ncbi:hypothetical protein HS1genome_2319 [Sulfodiicoccus acidiphilus]|uniref:Secondary thiamine-phosphate synthase enzyme n=1 Tax=Sulfodiicoccus acidiphilus TaxID=1670455 RepID=A0A348B6X8_9CREN|nr:secondary thiamine-phosphate synthase enzyme YjbQ [Sulfodiicoccus acidiphilus]BBD73930.1 hypothetical protein HS1genome_2319 [Sulfodiicoccus acidiphilus]GGU03312.1 hypothetical protein GCM10007116_20320 [Sulfodiicoccus acidiphilus]